MKRQILIITEKIQGGEWIATRRLLDSFKKYYPSATYRYLTLEKRRDSKKHFGFIHDHIKYFLYSRSKISNQLGTRVDFILVSDYLWALAALSVKSNKTKLVFLFHGLRSIPFRSIADVDYRQILVKILERFSWIFSDTVIVPSKEAKDYILKNTKPLIRKKKIFLVPNIVPDNFFVSRIRKYTSKEYKILYSGRLGKYKGLENLINAFSKITTEIPGVNLTIAYPAVNADASIEKLISQNVKLVKNPTEKQLSELYWKSDVLILPSEIEFAPLSLLESLASGTPVIATGVGNLGRLLRKIDRNLILRNNSPEEIVRKLNLFYKYDPGRKNNISRAGTRVAKDFTAKKAVGKFKKVLNYLEYSTSR